MRVLKGLLLCILVVLIYSLGVLSYPLFEDIKITKTNSPSSFSIEKAQERSSPGDWTDETDFAITPEGLLYKNKKIILARFEDTNSMDPLLDKNTIGIEIPTTIEKVNVGDIVVYQKDGNKIIHRVIEKGTDEHGTYVRLEGDNSGGIKDPYKVRKIPNVLVGLFY